MRGGCQEHRFLAVDFLQTKIGGQQVPIGNLAFLHQFLNGLAHLGFVRRRLGRSRLEVGDQPVGFRQPTNTRPMDVRREINRHIELLFAGFELLENFLAICAEDIHEEVQIRLGVQAFRVQSLLRVEVREQNLAGAVCNDQGAVKSI